MVFHYLDLRSYLEGQSHSAHIPEIRVQAITPHCQVLFHTLIVHYR